MVEIHLMGCTRLMALFVLCKRDMAFNMKKEGHPHLASKLRLCGPIDNNYQSVYTLKTHII